MRKDGARLRGDGKATRSALIEAAGELAAERGWSSVRAKDVCQRAGMSPSSVNYWFGSREALYREVISRIPMAIFSERELRDIASASDTEATIRMVIRSFLQRPSDRSNWEIRLWAREMFTGPSDVFMRLVSEKGLERMWILKVLFGGHMGLEPDDPRVEAAIVSVVGSCLLVISVPTKVKAMLLPSIGVMSVKTAKILENILLERIPRQGAGTDARP